jgi:hypothetical protein
MRLLRTALALTAGLAGALLLTPAAAQAAQPTCHRIHQQSGNNVGLLNGNNVDFLFDPGFNVSDIAFNLLGSASAGAGDHNVTVSCGN